MLDKALTRLAEIILGGRSVPEPPAALPGTVPDAPHRALSELDALDFKPGPTWHTLPGQRIELGATGFQISLHPETPLMLYQLWGPAGEALGGCSQLDVLKAYGAIKAREREEFAWAPRPQGAGE